MTDSDWLRFAWRCVACHTATYLVAGLLAANLFDYAAEWPALVESAAYRPLDDPWIARGSALQVIRGLVLGLVLYPVRDTLLERPRGWLVLWGLLAGIGIVSTYGPAPGSVEGLIYTTLPLRPFGLVEVGAQSLAFSLCLWGWYRHPHRAWGWVLGALTAFALFAGLLAPTLQELAEQAGS